ncbi:hypothetical protein [Segatella sp.]|uniref:hypothetical protein n=1 Tax=Segatella sp. TaxID=2974253 RepID=UPI0030799239
MVKIKPLCKIRRSEYPETCKIRRSDELKTCKTRHSSLFFLIFVRPEKTTGLGCGNGEEKIEKNIIVI